MGENEKVIDLKKEFERRKIDDKKLEHEKQLSQIIDILVCSMVVLFAFVIGYCVTEWILSF